MTEKLNRDQIISVLRNGALEDSEHGWLSDLSSQGLKWSENDQVIWFDWADGSVDVGHLAEIVEKLIDEETKTLIERVEAAEAAIQRVRELATVAQSWASQGNMPLVRTLSEDILRALDGGDQE